MNIKKGLGFAIFFLGMASILIGQGSIWGVKGGLSLGIQQWNSFEKQVLVASHADITYESLTDDSGAFSFFIYGGYHVRGSANRHRGYTYIDNAGTPRSVSGRTERFEFRNVVMTFGAKQKFELSDISKYYYLIGLRAEYTLSTQFGSQGNAGSAFGLSEFYVNDFNYGAIVGGGTEVMLSDALGGYIEFNVSPDFSKQYLQPPLNNVSDPNNPGNIISIGERSVVNISFEISLGIKFHRRIEYLEDEESQMW
jgi:hypothetical protein